jgi:carboxyl-terminal processing protease
MSRSRILFFVFSSLLVIPMLMGTFVLAAERAHSRANGPGTGKEDDSFYKYLAVFSDVFTLVRDSYVDEPNTEELMKGALEGVTDALDPFSVFVPADEVDAFLKAHVAAKLDSGLDLIRSRGTAYVVAVEKGSAAAQAGVQVGDLVAKLGGKPTRTMPLWELEEILAGTRGPKIELELIRLAAPVQVSFELKPFHPPAVSLEEVEGAPVMHIPSFGAETAAQARQLLASQAARIPMVKNRLVIDLRGVSSGDPAAAYATAKLFSTGDLGSLRRRKEHLQSFTGNEQPVWHGRIVVLVDLGTLGPGEILATVLRQKAGAELVGERTYGHAGREGVADLSGGARLFFTDAFYTGPDDKPINEGLKPDLLVGGRNRAYVDRDVPIEELILRRGVHRLLEEPEAVKKAA